MDIAIHLLQILNCLAMLGCTGMWFWIWYSNFKNYMRLTQKVEKLERRIEVLEFEIKVVQEPCYRGYK